MIDHLKNIGTGLVALAIIATLIFGISFLYHTAPVVILLFLVLFFAWAVGGMVRTRD